MKRKVARDTMQNKEATAVEVDGKQVTVDEAYGLAVVMYGRGDKEEAKALLERISHIDPGHAETQNALGIIALNGGDFESARQHALKAIDLDPRMEKARNTMGLILRQLGQLEAAAQMFQSAISLNPQFAEAHGNLGNVLLLLEKCGEAAVVFRNAAEIRPDCWEFHYHQAVALENLGVANEAETAFRKALDVKPGLPHVCNDLGSCLAKQGNLRDAEVWYREALRIVPDFPLALKNLAQVLAETGRPQEAETCYRQLLATDPANIDVTVSLGEVLTQLHRDDEALSVFQQALSLDSQCTTALIGIADAQGQLDNHAEAEKALHKALALEPESVYAHNKLGLLQMKLGRYEEAKQILNHAQHMMPSSVKTLTNLGILHMSVGELHTAAEVLQKAIAIEPHCYHAICNLGLIQMKLGDMVKAVEIFREVVTLAPWHSIGWSNMASALIRIGKIQEALEILEKLLSSEKMNIAALVCLGEALSKIGKTSEAITRYREALALDPTDKIAQDSLLFTMNYSPSLSAKDLYLESKRWGESIEIRNGKQTLPKLRKGKKALRIGYVSPDFRSHPVSFFFSSLIKGHNHDIVEVFCYSDVTHPDSMTFQLRSFANVWRDCYGMSDESLAETIRRDKIDILVDLAGHTGGNRLCMFAMKPAPVQVTWLGYPATTGLSTIDYRLTDAIADPEGEADLVHTEKLVRLPLGFLCYSPPEQISEVGPPAFEHNGFVTFGSFNNTSKITSETCRTWGEILRRLPNSRLLLKDRIFCEEMTQRMFLSFFIQSGIDPERVTFLPYFDSTREHLQTYRRLDISLDTSPYNGTTTTCESLWMGVPVITRLGDRHVARVGGSILTRLGLTDLISKSQEEYVEKAIRLAEDLRMLRELRENLRKMMELSPLCDIRGFANQVEEAFLRM